MWVSKSRIEALERKIHALDDKLAALECVVRDDSSIYIYGRNIKKISVKEAINRLLSHLGLQFRHVSSHESVVLEKAMITTIATDGNPYIPTTTPKKKGRKP